MKLHHRFISVSSPHLDQSYFQLMRHMCVCVLHMCIGYDDDDVVDDNHNDMGRHTQDIN